MIEIEEKAVPVYVDMKGGDVTANIAAEHDITVTVGESAQMDVAAAINFIESGKAEIKPLVDEVKGYRDDAVDSAQSAAQDANEAADSAIRAETAAEVAENMANKDLSNLSDTGVAKFDAKQDVIDDLSTIREGAALGATALQPTDLATVATTGLYTDLLDKPTIPTKTSDLSNDSGFITSSALTPYVLSASLATVATSGSYNDLSDKPTIPASQVNSDWDASSGVAQILNKPSIPTDTSDLTNGAGYITSSALSGYATETWVGNQGYITGITSGDVTTALGYTPYDASNPSGYTSNIGTVTSVNSISPVNGNVTLSIPTVNNSTITLTQGGTTKGTFTLNQATGTTIDFDAGGGGGSYTAGTNISITNNEISTSAAKVTFRDWSA